MARWFDELSRKFPRFPFFAFILNVTRFSQKFVTSFASRFFEEIARFYAEYSTKEEKSLVEGRPPLQRKTRPFISVLSFLSFFLIIRGILVFTWIRKDDFVSDEIYYKIKQKKEGNTLTSFAYSHYTIHCDAKVKIYELCTSLYVNF